MNKYIEFKCKHCGKQYKILEQWGDLKPRRCSGKKGMRPCGVNFERNPEMLEIKLPKKARPVKKVSQLEKIARKRSKDNDRSEKQFRES